MKKKVSAYALLKKLLGCYFMMQDCAVEYVLNLAATV
jgi:hypothetical protein